MINTCVVNQDRPLCDPVAPRAVSWALVHNVLKVEAATGIVKFENLIAHRDSKSVTFVEGKDTRKSRLDANGQRWTSR